MPQPICDGRSFTAGVRTRGGEWERTLAESLKITVNKQFAEPKTKINNDELPLFADRPHS